MDERNAHLIAFIEAITTGQTHQFEHVVKTAYIAGASRDDLLTACEIARFLADVAEPVLTEAGVAAHAWDWMVARRLEHQRSLAPPGRRATRQRASDGGGFPRSEALPGPAPGRTRPRNRSLISPASSRFAPNPRAPSPRAEKT